ATVASLTLNGVPTQAVFVAGGQDNVTALDTSNGNIIWQTNLGTNKAEYLYGATSVYNGSVYVGVSSFGDCPLTQGQVVQLNAASGELCGVRSRSMRHLACCISAPATQARTRAPTMSPWRAR